MSPLSPDLQRNIVEEEIFSVRDLAGESILNEVDEVFNIALNRNKNTKSGKCFHLLNHYFNLAQNNQVINPLMFEKATEFMQEKLRMLSRNATTCNCDYNSYIDSLNKLKVSVLNEINNLNIGPIYKDYYRTKFEEEFLNGVKIMVMSLMNLYFLKSKGFMKMKKMQLSKKYKQIQHLNIKALKI